MKIPRSFRTWRKYHKNFLKISLTLGLVFPASALRSLITSDHRIYMVRTDDYDHALVLSLALAGNDPNNTVHPVAATGSMAPLIDENCLVVVVRRPWKEIQKGDIVSLDRKGGIFGPEKVCHRVIFVASNNRFVSTKGDNNPRQDLGVFRKADYLGSVVAIVRFANIAPRHESMTADQLKRYGIKVTP